MYPVEVVEYARNTCQYILVHNKRTTMVNQDDNAGKRSQDKYNSNNVKQWSPSSVGWLKRNTYASKIDVRHSPTIGIVYRYNIGRV